MVVVMAMEISDGGGDNDNDGVAQAATGVHLTHAA